MNDFIKKYIKTPTNIVDVINMSKLTHENEIKINIMSNSAADIAIDVDDDVDDNDDNNNIRYGEITTNEEKINDEYMCNMCVICRKTTKCNCNEKSMAEIEAEDEAEYIATLSLEQQKEYNRYNRMDEFLRLHR